MANKKIKIMAEESPFSKIPSQLNQIPEGVPVVFISYSWDNESHKQWVVDLSKDLREKFRIYTLLDCYNRGGDDLITFMQKGLKRADRVLIIGTPNYKNKLESSIGGGVKFEDQVITIALYKEMGSNKFVPILREGAFSESFNELIETRLGYDMSNDGYYEERLQELAADLWGTPINIAPTLGPKPNFTPASQTLHSIVPESKEDYSTLVKNYLLDNSKQILLTELIENESKKAFKTICNNANYGVIQDSISFGSYIEIHQKAIENLMATVVPIVRYGTLEQQKLLVEAMALLCKMPFINGHIILKGSENVHLLASTFLFHAVGVACVKYQKFGLIHEMMQAKVTAPNVFSPNHSLYLEYLSGCNHWDYNSLNIFLNATWIYPYSQMVMSAIKNLFSEVFFDDDEFTNYYYAWEHLASLSCRYYKCCQLADNWNPLGGFVRKRIAMLRPSDDFYTQFFREAFEKKENWEPLKQGLFNGNFSEFATVYEVSEKFYKQNMKY